MNIKQIRQSITKRLAENMVVSYHSHQARVSDTPIDSEVDLGGVVRKEVLESLVRDNPNGTFCEVGIIEKIREEILAKAIIEGANDQDILSEVVDAENRLISLRFRSAVVPDLSLVDLEGTFYPSEDQLQEAAGYLSARYEWYATADQFQQHRYIDHYLRYKYLPPIDYKNDATQRVAALKYLNKRLRFVRMEVPANSYIDVHLGIVGVDIFNHKNPKVSHPRQHDGEFLHLEIMDKGLNKVLKIPFVTSTGTLEYLDSKLPVGILPKPDSPSQAFARLYMLLSGLMRSSNRFTGRFGVSPSGRHGEVSWVWSEPYIPSYPELASVLPNSFRIFPSWNVGQVRNIRRECFQRVQALSARVQSPIALFNVFYHMTHVDNLESIRDHGLLSKHEVSARGLLRKDIANPSVQQRRESAEPCFKRSIHSYVPLYLNPRNPMLYNCKEIQESIVILQVGTDVVDRLDHVFTDGNAASDDTEFSYDPCVIESSLPVLSAESWTDFYGGKRRRCAEVLVFPRVPRELIVSARCLSPVTAIKVKQVLGIPAIVGEQYFFMNKF